MMPNAVEIEMRNDLISNGYTTVKMISINFLCSDSDAAE